MSEETEGEQPPLPEGAAGTAAHDAPVPDRLTELMSGGWAPPSDSLPPLDDVAGFTRRRRAALAAAFPGETLVIPTGNPKVRANDTDYVFRPGSDFFWLTGCHESDAVVVIADENATLYLADRSDRSTSAFYRDRRYGELWVGPRKGVKETQAELGIDTQPIEDLPAALDKLDRATTRLLNGYDVSVDALLNSEGDHSERDAELARVMSDLRLIKDDYEVARLRDAVSATVVGFAECVRELEFATTTHRGERWLEGTFWRRARLDGNDVGYTSIVASGHHATTLHWMKNDGVIRDGDLVLLDMGIESDSLYTADVTRTIPVNGRFNEVQRRVYDVVYRAQRAAIAAIRPGVGYLDPHRAAMQVIAEALEDWGILSISAEESMQEGVGLHRRYTLHATSHMLGLDVHDCAAAREELYYKGTLEAGMVLTAEPGLYFQIDDMTVPEELRGIGVRIEDDVLVTPDGCDVLSSALPTAADDVEAWMAEILR